MDSNDRDKSDRRSYLAKYGISTKGAVRVTLGYAGLSAVLISGFFSLCYVYKPAQMIVSRLNWPRINKLYASMQAKIGPKHGRVASAIGEAIVLDSICSPVSIPVKVWLAVKFVSMGQGSAEEVTRSS
jgi:hypothetical protein